MRQAVAASSADALPLLDAKGQARDHRIDVPPQAHEQKRQRPPALSSGSSAHAGPRRSSVDLRRRSAAVVSGAGLPVVPADEAKRREYLRQCARTLGRDPLEAPPKRHRRQGARVRQHRGGGGGRDELLLDSDVRF